MKKILLLGLLFYVSCTLTYGQSEKEEAWEKFFNPKNICGILGVYTKSDLENAYGEVTLSKYSPQSYIQLYWGSLFKENKIDVTLMLWKSTNIAAHAEVKGMSSEKYHELVKKFRDYGFKDVKLPHYPLEMEKDGIRFSATPYNSNSYVIQCWSVEKMKGSDVIDGSFDLMPSNMINYIGKVDKNQFEKIVGSPTAYEAGNVVVYNVINEYTKMETGIRCFYHETTGKLISVRFGTRSFMGYFLDFVYMEGFNEKLHMKTSVPLSQNPSKIEFKFKGLSCQITNIVYGVGTATINYHTY